MLKRTVFLSFIALCVIAISANRFAMAQKSGPVEIKITASRFQFEPRTITVQKGKSVRLLITSTDTDHGFAIKELGIERKLKATETTVVEFTPSRIGKFEFSCSVFCGAGHEEMTGELVVTEEQATATAK